MPEQQTCNTCGATFQRREHHQRHLRTHTKEKPFACSMCGSTYGRIDSLARHYNSAHVDPATQMASENGERQRVSRACKRCSTAKVRCDGKPSCEKCTVAGVECFYEPPKKRKAAHQPALESQPKHRATGQDSQPTPRPQDSQREEASVPSVPSAPSVPALTPAASEGQPAEGQPVYVDSIDPQLSTMATLIDLVTPDFMHLDFFSGPRSFDLHNHFNNTLTDMSDNLDIGFGSMPFDVQQETQLWQDIGCAGITPPQQFQQPEFPQFPHFPQYQLPHLSQPTPHKPNPHIPPTPASDIADIFSRSHSPVMDRDAVDVRQYNPTSIEVDVPLTLPVIDASSIVQADMEDFAHVEALSREALDAVASLIDDVQTKPHYPLFRDPKMPPPSVFNAWIQLYFEYFHPVFPIIHKATFSSSETPSLLVLAVAAVGAQFSSLPNSQACARSLQELVRRLGSRHCEFQNKHGRTVWMTQVVMLNNLAMAHSGERRGLEIAEILQAIPVALARRKGLLDDVMTHERISQLQLPLEQTWRLWAVDETRRRTGFGVWLVDSAYRSNFYLTTVLNQSELRNSLPQAETKWNAGNAQSWASYPPGLGSGRLKPLADIVEADGLLANWSKTGTIGKQVILQALMDRVRPTEADRRGEAGPNPDSEHARETLEHILCMLKEERETPVNDLKALISHQVICLAALMLHSSPDVHLTTVAMSRIYKRMDDRELSEVAQVWRRAPYQGRVAVLHAAQLFVTIRNNHTTHYSMPAYLLRAVLTLWLYSLLFEKPEVTGFTVGQDVSTSIALGTGDIDGAQCHEWIANGNGRIKLPGMANLLCIQGRRRLLSESAVAMGSLKSWGISRGYLRLLKRLETSEAALLPP